MKKNNKRNPGIFLGLLFAFCKYLSSVFHAGRVYALVSSHDKVKEKCGSSVTAFLFKALSLKCRKYVETVKKFIARQFERSLMLRLISSAVSRVISLPGRVLGSFFMTWGAYVALIFLIKKYALFDVSASVADLLSGAIVFVASLPLIFTDKSLRMLCNESPMISSVLIKVFGIPCEALRSGTSKKAGQSSAVIFGIILGLLTYFIPPFDMICGMIAIAVIALIFAYPEGGVLISIAISPFLGLTSSPSVLLAVSVILTAISYFIKVLRGKRVFKIGVTGFAVYAFMVMVFLSGFAPGESNTMENALLCCSLMLIFPLIVNLMKSRHWINACIISFCVPSAIVAFIGIAQYMFGMSPSGWVDSTLFSEITSRAVSVFNNPNIFGVYLSALFPMALMLTLPKYNSKIRLLGGILACYIASAAVLTYSRSAWIALIAGAIIFATLVTPKGILWLIPAAAAVVAVAIIFPDTVGVRLLNFVSLSDSANNYRVAVWNSSWKLLSDSFWFGIGWGEEAFKTAYMNYAADGTQYAMHSHSLFMQIAIQTGLVGLLIFAVSVFSVVSKCIGASKQVETDRELALNSKAAITGAFSIMIAGIFDYTWYNFRVFFIFWALLALACAAVNVIDRENDAVQYPDDDDYSSFLTVPIPKPTDAPSDLKINKEK